LGVVREAVQADAGPPNGRGDGRAARRAITRTTAKT
jgi:hypothetical protein